MSREYSENVLVQNSAGNLLQNVLGWEVVLAYNSEKLGSNGTLGRTSYGEVLLTRYFRQALLRLNPWLTPNQLDEVQKKFTAHVSTASLMQINEEKYFLLRDGIPVTVKRPDGRTEIRSAAVIDFKNPENNHFLAVKEMKIHSQLYRRRTDIVGFVNGIPLLFIELKKPTVDVQNAYIDNYRDYLDTIPQLFYYNAFLMIDDCEAGNIDMIITKSISRFARNTLDCLKYIRQLKDKNIPVFFEKESINTMDAKGEVLITIMASLAQQESQSLSQNVKLGLQFRYQNGQVQVNHNHFLGYTKDADGNLIIDPEQAEVVKRIYREYLEGYSMDRIAKGLEADGILTGAGKTKWWTSTINKILRNEKYIGDALLQKTYTTDFLNKTRVKNNGIVPQYYVEGNHEAIIPKDIFLQVQEELVRRRVVKTSANGKKRSYSCNHCFAQIVICGECGEMFRRIHWNNRGCKSIVWRCISRLEPAGQECHARTVNETVLENVVVQAINTLLGDKSTYQAQLQQNIAKVIRSAQQNTADGINERLQELQKELLKKANNKEAYDEIADEIFKLREQREKCTVDTAVRDAQIARINELQDFIKQQPAHLEAFDEALVKRWLERIIVWENHFTVELKSGLNIDIEG